MDYTEAVQMANDLKLTNIRHFDLDQTLDCGQAFRYEKFESGYKGIANGRRIELVHKGSDLVLKDVNISEFDSTWKEYFDLQRNYDMIRGHLAQHGGAPMKLALDFSPGLRHMRQDPWEMLISFILSQNTNIPRIKTMIRRLCESFGDKLSCGGYMFPTYNKLAELSTDDLAVIKSGYRAKFVTYAARFAASGGFDRIELQQMNTPKLRGRLLQIYGVGPKVADCVLLFGFGRIEVCPKDVWIKRALERFYPKGFPDELLPFAGIAQQFLFHYIRNSGDENNL